MMGLWLRIPVLVVAGWLYCMTMWVAGVWALLVTIPMKTVRLRAALWGVCLAAAMASSPLTWGQLKRGLDDLSQHKEAYHGRHLVAATGLNVVMGLGGIVVGFPEVALETLLLLVPDPDGQRSFSSGFAMHSHKVRHQLLQWAQRAESRDCQGTYTHKVYWDRYHVLDDSLRVSLATNPVVLAATARRHGSTCVLDVIGRVEIRYPHTHRIPVAGGVVLDEGVFWGLQQAGIMHPYRATWHWSVLTDDPELWGSGVHRTWFERLLVFGSNPAAKSRFQGATN